MAENFNNTVSSNLQEKQDNLARQFETMKPDIVLPEKQNILNNSVPQFGGSKQDFLNTLRSAQKGGRLAADRALKAQQTFLKPRYTRKQMEKKFYKSRRK